MIPRERFEYLYGRLMNELGIDPDKPNRVEQAGRWFQRFKGERLEVLETAFYRLPELMGRDQQAPTLPQMLEAVKLAHETHDKARAVQGSGEWCGLCEGRGTVTLVKVEGAGFYPAETALLERKRGTSYAFRCPCPAGDPYRPHMAVFHDGRLVASARPHPRHAEPVPAPERVQP